MLTKEIETPRFVLACLTENDATETYLSWMNRREINQYLESRFAPHDLQSLSAFITSIRESRDSYLFGIFSREGSHHGNIKLGPISYEHRTASIGLIIGDDSVWGKGVATEVISAVSSWAFSTLSLEKLTAGSYQQNGGSIRAFEKSGYSVEGLLRSQVRLVDGERDDVVLLGRTRNPKLDR